jgi:hypothetical protein
MRSASVSIAITNGMGSVLRTVELGSAKRAERVVTLFIIAPRSVSGCGYWPSHRQC